VIFFHSLPFRAPPQDLQSRDERSGNTHSRIHEHTEQESAQGLKVHTFLLREESVLKLHPSNIIGGHKSCYEDSYTHH
jgi:hypothetical protein